MVVQDYMPHAPEYPHNAQAALYPYHFRAVGHRLTQRRMVI
jgi:hypothetical protein